MPGEEVIAEAYDFPIPGYDTKTCSNLRLWDALAVKEFDLEAFNAGDYSQVGGWVGGWVGAVREGACNVCVVTEIVSGGGGGVLGGGAPPPAPPPPPPPPCRLC